MPTGAAVMGSGLVGSGMSGPQGLPQAVLDQIGGASGRTRARIVGVRQVSEAPIPTDEAFGGR